jgi:hypothetical protein
MVEKDKKSKISNFRDATILGTTVYNSVYKSKIPSVIIKDVYLRKDLVIINFKIFTV